MSYSTYDFTESLERSTIARDSVASVVLAWGHGEGMGTDAGHPRWSEHGASDWSGGFVMQMHDGRFCYLTGWCDYTGWGCQDGIAEHWFDARPTQEQLEAATKYTYPPIAEWDIEPADLNRWIRQGQQ